MGRGPGRLRRRRVAWRRRVGRTRCHCDEPQCLPVVRPRVPRSRRGPGPAGAAQRPHRLAGAAVRRMSEQRAGRKGADEKLQRMVALVPWVAARDGPTLTEVCDRFGCTEAELVADLDRLFMCGLYPYTPDVLIEVDVAEGRVWIRYADYFSRPLRLTPAEGLALLAAGKVVQALPGADSSGPVARGLDKLAAALGIGSDEALDVAIGQ